MAENPDDQSRHKRGIALIFVVGKFNQHEPRKGAQCDLKMLTYTFRKLNCDVRTFSDLTSTNIILEARQGQHLGHILECVNAGMMLA